MGYVPRDVYEVPFSFALIGWKEVDAGGFLTLGLCLSLIWVLASYIATWAFAGGGGTDVEGSLFDGRTRWTRPFRVGPGGIVDLSCSGSHMVIVSIRDLDGSV